MMETVTYGRTVICNSLTNPSATTAERSDLLAEEEPHDDAGAEAGQNLLRERHRL